MDYVGEMVCDSNVPEDTPKIFKITEFPPGQICRLFGPNPDEYGPTVTCIDNSNNEVECTVDSLNGEVEYRQTGPVTLWAACYGKTIANEMSIFFF